jgi:hypothetical protein
MHTSGLNRAEIQMHLPHNNMGMSVIDYHQHLEYLMDFYETTVQPGVRWNRHPFPDQIVEECRRVTEGGANDASVAPSLMSVSTYFRAGGGGGGGSVGVETATTQSTNL